MNDEISAAVKKITEFQPFICWSVAFESGSPGRDYSAIGSFNPLFVGVWLLNLMPGQNIFPVWKFQPFICWSVAFEFADKKTLSSWIAVSTLYLLECGF